MNKLALTFAIVLTARAEADCSNADAKLAQGEVAAAKAMYTQALTAGDSPCARVALDKLAAEAAEAAGLVELGRAKKAVGNFKGAREDFLNAVEADPTSSVAMDALSDINNYVKTTTTPPITINRVRQLLRIDRAEALIALKDLLKTSPSGYVVPSDVVTHLDGYGEALALKRAGFNEDARTATKAAVKSSIPLPTELERIAEPAPHFWMVTQESFNYWKEPIAGFLSIVLLTWTIAWFVVQRQRLRVVIADFTPADGPMATTPSFGTSMTAIVREALGRLSGAKGRYSIAAIQDPVGNVVIPDAVTAALPASISTIAKLLPEIVQRFARGRVLQVVGRIHSPGSRGTGITLAVSSHKGTVKSVTIWQKEFDPGRFRGKILSATDFGAADYYVLAEPAAVWLLFALNKIEDWS